MKNKIFYFLMLVLSSLFFPEMAKASLINLGNGTVFDSDQGLVWLADANLAASETFGVTDIPGHPVFGIPAIAGAMSWDTAQTWIAAMNAANYKGYSNWRLPTVGPACPFSCKGGEWTHWYEELGGDYNTPLWLHHNQNFDLFSNIQINPYWSTEISTIAAWSFIPNASGGGAGIQGGVVKFFNFSVLPVASIIPEPSTLLLLAPLLTGLLVRKRTLHHAVRSVNPFDRVEITRLRPSSLPHHRTCCFPHPAVESTQNVF